MVPLFARRPNSIVVEGEATNPYAKSVPVSVEWQESRPSPKMAETGIEKPLEREVKFLVPNEVRLPKENAEPKDWSGNEDLHPFWLIKRHDAETERNCSLHRQKIDLKQVLDFTRLQQSGATIPASFMLGNHTFSVMYPFIVNDEAIPEDTEVVLKVSALDEKPRKKTERASPAFDALKREETKGLKVV